MDLFFDNFDQQLDLKIERIVDVSQERIWEAWTNPELILPWFCPKPWIVKEAVIDLRPGGEFRTVFCSPQGEEFINIGCYLDLEKNRKIIWTDLMLPGFRPSSEPVSSSGFLFTAGILISEVDGKTKYTAICKHRNPEDRKKHEEMGFTEGWNICLDQLIEFLKTKNA